MTPGTTTSESINDSVGAVELVMGLLRINVRCQDGGWYRTYDEPARAGRLCEVRGQIN